MPKDDATRPKIDPYADYKPLPHVLKSEVTRNLIHSCEYQEGYYAIRIANFTTNKFRFGKMDLEPKHQALKVRFIAQRCKLF
jgi:hypothetical protein